MPTISPNKPYRIGRSRTGLGLFATKPIKKGTRIIRYLGRMLDCSKEKDDAVENKYLFQITSRWTIDGSMRSNIARYINHSCKPNAESDVRKIKRRVDIRAIKDIAPGEEINYDYGTEYFKEYLKPIGCKCDSCEKKRKKLRASAREEKKQSQAKTEKRTVDGNGRRKLNGHKARSAAPKKSKVLATAKGGRSKKRSLKKRH